LVTIQLFFLNILRVLQYSAFKFNAEHAKYRRKCGKIKILGNISVEFLF
jgi:hypothetical protein